MGKEKKKTNPVVPPNKGGATTGKKQTREDFLIENISNYEAWTGSRKQSKFFVKPQNGPKRTYTVFKAANQFVMTNVMNGISVKIETGSQKFTMKLTRKK